MNVKQCEQEVWGVCVDRRVRHCILGMTHYPRLTLFVVIRIELVKDGTP